MSTSETKQVRVGAQNPGDALLALLTRQKFMVDQLLALAKKQSAHVQDGNAEALLDLLGKRQELIDRVMAAQEEVAPLAKKIEIGSTAALNAAQRTRAAELMEAIQAGLGEVMKQDDVDRDAINAAREKARGELTTLSQARQARSAYSLQKAAADARFADRKG